MNKRKRCAVFTVLFVCNAVRGNPPGTSRAVDERKGVCFASTTTTTRDITPSGQHFFFVFFQVDQNLVPQDEREKAEAVLCESVPNGLGSRGQRRMRQSADRRGTQRQLQVQSKIYLVSAVGHTAVVVEGAERIPTQHISATLTSVLSVAVVFFGRPRLTKACKCHRCCHCHTHSNPGETLSHT